MKKLILSAFVIAASGAYVWSQAGSTSDPLLASANLQTGSVQPQSVSSSGGTMKPREVPFVTGGSNAPSAPASSTTLAAQAPADNSALPPLPAPADSSGFAPAPAASNPQPSAPAAPAPAAPFAVAEAQPPAAPSAPAPASANTVNIPLPRLRPPYRQVAAVAPTPAPASAPSSTSGQDRRALLARISSATSGLNDGTYRGPVVNAYYGLMQIEAVIRNGRLATIHVLRYPHTHTTSVYINHRALPVLRNEVISAQSARVDTVSGATLSSHAFIRSLGAALRKARV